MAILANYPNLSQRAVKVNGALDCVPTSLVDALEYLTGKKYDVYDVVTAAYGPNYVGFTSAAKFVAFCASQGVKLFPIDGDNAVLVQDIHKEIEALHPVLLTEPDVYAPLHPDWSHVLSLYAEAPGTLTARDPYSTVDVTHSDADWAKLLEYREIWVLEREGTMGVPQGWHDDGATLTAPNGVHVVHGFRDYVLKNNWRPDNWPLAPEAGVARLEDSNPSLGAGSQQLFRFAMLGWNAEHGVIFEWLGQELAYYRQQAYALLQANKQLQVQVAQLQQQATMPQEHASVQQFLEQVGPLYGYKHA